MLPSTCHAPAVNISDSDLLYLTKLGNPFQIKDPKKCTELVPQTVDLAGGMKSTGPHLKLWNLSVFEVYHMNWGFKVQELLYVFVNSQLK